MKPEQILKQFKQTKWYRPTVMRYQAHLDACESQGCKELIEPFMAFVSEIANAPSDTVRAEMLAEEEPPPYEPRRSYQTYTMPITAEMFASTPPGSNKPRGKRKPKKKPKRRTK